MPKPRIYDHLAETWKAEYLSGLSVHKIGKRHGVRGQSVHAYLVRLGQPRRSLEVSIRKSPILSDAFAAPISGEAAYWLGLLYADGGVMVSKSGCAAIGLTAHSDDVESIQGFLSFLGLVGPIRYRPDKRAVSTAVSSKTLLARLAELGCGPRKTHTMRWPVEIKDGLVAPFVRGYLDGDGCIHFRMRPRYVTPQGSIGFSGNPLFMGDVADRIEAHTGMKPTGSVQHRKTRLIQYEGRLRLLKLAEWLYSDGGTRLGRKLKTLTDNIGYIACAGEIASG
jgi:hypothetical protein